MRRTDFPPVSLEAWRQRVRSELDGAGPETLVGRSLDGLELEPLYTEASTDGRVAPAPARPTPPRLCPRVDAVGADAVATEIAEHLDGGADGVWLGGIDERDLGAGAELDVAFDAERLSGAEVWLDAGSEVVDWSIRWCEWLERAGLDADAATIHFGADPLGRLARRGAVGLPIGEALDGAVRTSRHVAERLPGSTAITVSSVPYQEAGADLATELGFAVATLLDYTAAAVAAGLDAGGFLGRVTVRFAVGCQIFPEIAKLRAVRLLWRALAGALDLERVPALGLHVVGSRRGYSRREPRLNLLRATEQGVVAVCGGATAVSLPAHDGLGGASGARGRRLARSIPLVLAHEGRLGRVADPAAGAYMVEAATRRLAEAGWRLAREIEARGGMAEELVSGRAAERVEAAWRQRRRAYEEGRAGLVGVTEFVDEEAPVLPAAAGEEGNAGRAGADGERIEPFLLRRDAAPYEPAGEGREEKR